MFVFRMMHFAVAAVIAVLMPEVSFLAIIDKFQSTSIFDHPPLFAKSGLVLPSDDSLAVSAALPAWIGI